MQMAGSVNASTLVRKKKEVHTWATLYMQQGSHKSFSIVFHKVNWDCLKDKLLSKLSTEVQVYITSLFCSSRASVLVGNHHFRGYSVGFCGVMKACTILLIHKRDLWKPITSLVALKDHNIPHYLTVSLSCSHSPPYSIFTNGWLQRWSEIMTILWFNWLKWPESVWVHMCLCVCVSALQSETVMMPSAIHCEVQRTHHRRRGGVEDAKANRKNKRTRVFGFFLQSLSLLKAPV